MKYSELIKKEFLLYKEQQNDLLKRDVSFVLKNLDNGFALTKQSIETSISDIDKALEHIKNIFGLCEKIENHASTCKNLVEAIAAHKMLEQKIDNHFMERHHYYKERATEKEAELSQKYSELNEFRKQLTTEIDNISIPEADKKKLLASAAWKVGEYFKKMNERLEKVRANLQAQFDALDPYALLLEEDKQALLDYANSAKKLSLCFWTGSKNDYINIKRLVVLACMRREDVDLGDNKLSVVCRERFDEINYSCPPEFNLSDLAMSRVPLFKAVGIKYADLSDTEAKIDKDDSNVYMLSEQFIDQALKFIDEDPDINLPSLALRLFDEYFVDPSDKFLSHRESLLEFKRLYEETPEEILVTEQRYYSQKMLEEEQEKRAMLQEQYEEERQYQEELEYRRQREAKRAERARRREEEQRRQEEERKIKKDIHYQCVSCARYNGCSMRDKRPNCSAYIPK